MLIHWHDDEVLLGVVLLPHRGHLKLASLTRRLPYVALALTTIAFGLLIHLRGASLGTTAQDVIGDTLYAMMIAWWIGALVPDARLIARSAAAYAVCASIEVSQLWHAPVIDAMRATRLGRLVLGSGFDTLDLAAYAIGIASAAILELITRRARQPTNN